MIRAYRSEDKLAVIELLRKNIPAFFASEEEEDFRQYLENELEDYFVYQEGIKIIANGIKKLKFLSKVKDIVIQYKFVKK